MLRALLASLLVLTNPSARFSQLEVATSTATSTESEPSPSPASDPAAERQLLDLANQERSKAGLPPLQADEGLTKAARAHATAMAAQKQLSHQLAGEPSLTQRLAANTQAHLDRAAENVAFASSVDQAQDSLMHSPPHRANLLSAAYNVAGFSVVRSGAVLYVAQDFGHSLPNYSVEHAEEIVAASVQHMRSATKLSALKRRDDSGAQSSACAMAQADSLNTATSQDRYRYILRYTTMQPESLPPNAQKAISDHAVSAFSAGACYARTSKYPNGAYWMALFFY